MKCTKCFRAHRAESWVCVACERLFTCSVEFATVETGTGVIRGHVRPAREGDRIGDTCGPIREYVPVRAAQSA